MVGYYRPGVGSVGQGGYFQPRGGVAVRDGYATPLPMFSTDLISLPSIFPAPVRDFRMFDFASVIGGAQAQIIDTTWECHVMPNSPVDDWDAAARLIDEPLADSAGQTSSQLVGDMIDGVVYLLIASVTLDDGRILIRRGTLACVAQPLVGPDLPPGVVAFDYQKWVMLFPELSSVTPEQAQAYWNMACEIVRNDATSPICNLEEREDILLLLTAHIAALLGGPQGGGGFGPQITGGIGSKSVNGVSISGGNMLAGVTGTQAWYQLTRYGQIAWMKLRAYRLFYYVPGPQRLLIDPWTSWPWTIGGANPYYGCGRGRLSFGPPGRPGRPGPPGPPGPPGQPGRLVGRIYTDEKSIIGGGLSPDDPLRVWIVESDGDFDEPRTARRVYVDMQSIVGSGTTEDPLRAQTVDAGRVRGRPGIGHNRPPGTVRLADQPPPPVATDNQSIRGSGTDPDDPLYIDTVDSGEDKT